MPQKWTDEFACLDLGLLPLGSIPAPQATVLPLPLSGMVDGLS
jgi:hypothetical protein